MKGKRTYIIAFLMGVLTVAQILDWITPEQFVAIQSVLASLGLAALRAAVGGAASK